jgi:hypothetical protein
MTQYGGVRMVRGRLQDVALACWVVKGACAWVALRSMLAVVLTLMRDARGAGTSCLIREDAAACLEVTSRF